MVLEPRMEVMRLIEMFRLAGVVLSWLGGMCWELSYFSLSCEAPMQISMGWMTLLTTKSLGVK